MKKVLVIDDSELFRNFIAQKLGGFGFDVAQAVNGFDGIIKLRSESPELIIMDYYLSRNSSLEVLEKKNQDPNLRGVPVIMASSKIDRESLLKVSQLGVRKFFTKPVKVDAFIKAVSEVLGVNLEMDSTPCIIDANYNDGIIFIEVARGLNKDKIELLKYRLEELIKLYRIESAKVILMLTGLEIGANESLLLSGLVSNILECTRAQTRNIKVLTSSSYIPQFLKQRDNFAGIDVVPNLEAAMDGLLGSKADAYRDESNMIGGAFLANADSADKSSINLRFEGETAASAFNLADLAGNIRIAIVDDDMVIREVVKKAFDSVGIKIDTFEDGRPFLDSPDLDDFDLVFLDLMMPGMDGFSVLAGLREKKFNAPVIVLSALSKRETVIKAMKLGVKSYMIKPIQGPMAIKKAVEIIRLNF